MTKENKIPSIHDKDWQQKKELGKISKTFRYVGKDGAKSTVTAEATIYPGQQFELLKDKNTKTSKNGIDKLNSNAYSRDILKFVFGIDGTVLKSILDNKGPDLYNQMKTFALEISGLSLSEDEVEEEKN